MPCCETAAEAVGVGTVSGTELTRTILPWPGELQPAVLLGRRGRFTVDAVVAAAPSTAGSEPSGRVVLHLPNSGRLTSVLKEGHEAMYLPVRAAAERVTAGRLVLVREPVAGWVCTDANVPSRLLARVLGQGPGGLFERFGPYARVRTEPRHGAHRFDVALEAEGGVIRAMIECKSVTLVDEAGAGLFPDAPTARGAAHTRILGELAAGGEFWTALVFMVGRSDANIVKPHRDMDPGFGVALDDARVQGLEVLAFRMQVGLDGVGLGDELNVVG